MSLWTERITFKWFLQCYSGLKLFQYLASLIIVPREIALGRPFQVPIPFSGLDLGLRIALRVAGLVFWIVVFLWAGGKFWPADPSTKR